MSSRQEVRPASELSNDLFNNISQQMSSEIGAVVQKLVQ